MIALLFPPMKYIFNINEYGAVLYSFLGMGALYVVFSPTFSPSTSQLQFAFVCFCVVTVILGVFKKSNLARYPLSVMGVLLMCCFLLN